MGVMITSNTVFLSPLCVSVLLTDKLSFTYRCLFFPLLLFNLERFSVRGSSLQRQWHLPLRLQSSYSRGWTRTRAPQLGFPQVAHINADVRSMWHLFDECFDRCLVGMLRSLREALVSPCAHLLTPQHYLGAN